MRILDTWVLDNWKFTVQIFCFCELTDLFLCLVLFNRDEWGCENVQSPNTGRCDETSCDSGDSQHLHVPLNTWFAERYVY
jgi:hypothetical protein